MNKLNERSNVISPQENKNIVRYLYEELWTKKNLGVIDELAAENYVSHGEKPGLPTTAEGMKQWATMLHNAFPNPEVSLTHQIAEDDTVVTRFKVNTTHKGEFMGIPPTGNNVVVTGIAIHRLTDGKIAESWDEMDSLGMMQQIGAVPSTETR